MADISKYQSVTVNLSDGKDPINYWVQTGEILSSTQTSHTSVSGSGGGSSGHGQYQTINSVTVSSNTWTTDTIFYRWGNVERSVTLTNNPVPLRLGHCVSFILAKRESDKKGDWPYVALYNHDTQNSGMVNVSAVSPKWLPMWIKSYLIFLLPASYSIEWKVSHTLSGIFTDFLALLFATAFVFSFIFLFPIIFWARIKRNEIVRRHVQSIVDCMRRGNDLQSLEASA